MLRLVTLFLICLSQIAFAQDPRLTPPPSPTISPTIAPTISPTIAPAHPVYDEPEMIKSEPDNFMNQLTGMITTLGILLGLILFFTWLLKKMLNTRLEQVNAKSPIRILETRNISPKTAVHVVDVYGKQYVIAESVNGVTYLGEAAVEGMPTKSFEDFMTKKPN